MQSRIKIVLSLGQVFKESWLLFLKGIYVLVPLAYAELFVIDYITSLSNVSYINASEIFFLKVSLYVILVILQIFIISATICLFKNEKIEIKKILNSSKGTFEYFAALLLYIFIVGGGLIMFIIPGIIWALKYVFFGFAIVDKGIGPIDALKLSANLTNGIKWDLLILIIFIVILLVLGTLSIIGIFLTLPLAFLMLGVSYREALKYKGLK